MHPSNIPHALISLISVNSSLKVREPKPSPLSSATPTVPLSQAAAGEFNNWHALMDTSRGCRSARQVPAAPAEFLARAPAPGGPPRLPAARERCYKLLVSTDAAGGPLPSLPPPTAASPPSLAAAMRAAVAARPAAPSRPCTSTSAAGRALQHAAAPRRSVARRAVEAPGAEVPPLSEEVAAKLAELGIDFERSGLKYLSNDARVSREPGPGGAGCSAAAPPRAHVRPPHRPPVSRPPLRAALRGLITASAACFAYILPLSLCTHPSHPGSCVPWTASRPSLRRPRTKSAAATCGAT